MIFDRSLIEELCITTCYYTIKGHFTIDQKTIHKAGDPHEKNHHI
nr:hypothetical protein NAJENHFJ_00014 [Bacillus pumilus]